VQLVSKISNLCDPDPPKSQTDRQTEDMRSQDRALRCSASRGKNEAYMYAVCSTMGILDDSDSLLKVCELNWVYTPKLRPSKKTRA